MNISTGLSSINLPALSGSRGAKIYLWPAYNRGPIQNIPRVTRDDHGPFVYTKPDALERDKIFAHAQQNRDVIYTNKGAARTEMNAIAPGSLFDARA
ncbi:MAG TPA: hypothetical protein PK926_06480 [Spirochaetota bacterium]|nr:hypothetical protein [Spirochaetota bacterium]HPI89640.1 hypothetical protein [Spirochaetota bacterium]HPR49219.1 hypothetical protein [Spirochaetota bacterium]